MIPLRPLLLAAALGACRSNDVPANGPPTNVQSVAGCWTLARRDGVDDETMPHGLRLDTLPRATKSGKPHPTFPLQVRRLAWRRDGENYFPLMAWGFQAPDSVGVILHAPIGLRWHLRLRAFGDSLLGDADTYSDDLADNETFAIVARRTPCPPELRRDTSDAPSPS